MSVLLGLLAIFIWLFVGFISGVLEIVVGSKYFGMSYSEEKVKDILFVASVSGPLMVLFLTLIFTFIMLEIIYTFFASRLVKSLTKLSK